MPTRAKVWAAFGLELMPIMALPMFFVVGFLATVPYLLCGVGWLLLRDYTTAGLIFLGRLLLISPVVLVLAAVLLFPFEDRAPGGVLLIALWFAAVIITPPLTAIMLAVGWWPRSRTSEPVTP
jgi:hypothetical protein